MSAAARPGASGLRPVLVVDDDPMARRIAAGELTAAGLPVLEAESGTVALEVMAASHVSAVVVDQLMPGMSGLELTRRIRQSGAHRLLPILFTSSDDSPATRVRALRAGATDFMTKPVEWDELIARIVTQVRLATEWESRVSGLEHRSATVAELAGLGSDLNPTVAARLVCERISEAHSGVNVSIFALAGRPRDLTLLARAGARDPVIVEQLDSFEIRDDSPGWVHLERAGGGWAACAALRRGATLVGILTIEGGGEREEMVAAAIDYAATVSLQLGGPLGDHWKTRQRRSEVQHVLATRAFEPLFQPILDLSTDTVVGYEALTRLTDGRPILEFLADAEEANVRPDCELALLETALERSAAFRDGLWLSINLSPSVLIGRNEPLSHLVEAADSNLVVELTENERIDDYPAVRAALARLGDHVKLSVDDTGSGYASLRHVIDLCPHYLKLDRGWIHNLDHDEMRQALVAGMVGFCDHTGTALIAEGIERDEERAALERLGVRYGQGYLLGRPAPLPVTLP